MGNTPFSPNSQNPISQPPGTSTPGLIADLDDLFAKNSFEKQYIVGKGGFGKVWKVQSKKFNNQVYALKELSKARVIARKSLNALLLERSLLSKLNHPFIVNMRAAFQDRECCYLVLDYCSGGDLRYHLPYKFFNEEETRFMAACIILALEYVHSQGVVHRDIKPENLVFDEKGYLLLTDFGISRQLPMNSDNTGFEVQEANSMINGIVDTSGTPGYMSPESMCKLPHGPVSDYFAIGIIVYEMMYRKRPYSGANKQIIRDNILARQVQIKANEIPENWSIEAADFTNKLIRRKPQSRLGFTHGILELKNHPWFAGFDWNALAQKKLQTPWQPPKGDNFKGKNMEFHPQSPEEEKVLDEAEKLVRRDTIQKLFDGYYYDYKPLHQHQQQQVHVMSRRISLQHAKEQTHVPSGAVFKKSRNAIQLLNKISPHKANAVNVFEVKEKNFKQMANKGSNYSNGSTAISSQKSPKTSINHSMSSGGKVASLPKLQGLIGSPKLMRQIQAQQQIQ